jgi:hypothetical protein
MRIHAAKQSNTENKLLDCFAMLESKALQWMAKS